MIIPLTISIVILDINVVIFQTWSLLGFFNSLKSSHKCSLTTLIVTFLKTQVKNICHLQVQWSYKEIKKREKKIRWTTSLSCAAVSTLKRLGNTHFFQTFSKGNIFNCYYRTIISPWRRDMPFIQSLWIPSPNNCLSSLE